MTSGPPPSGLRRARAGAPAPEDLICFSHLRWNFVFQRPQHLMTRCARERRVFFVEEPVFDTSEPRLDLSRDPSGVTVVVPHLPPGEAPATQNARTRVLVGALLEREAIESYIAWYYTPMALRFSDHLRPCAVVYDCMDELSAFAGAPPDLRDAERDLLRRADLVFTGGVSLYESKRRLHSHVHAFPSSVDVPHFARARTATADPADQAGVPRPRLGFFGVVDERFDRDLVAGVARGRPDWHLVIVGPVVKIDPAALPRAANLHYLGPKTYGELPDYIAGWDVALLPFARNEATRFISPTKTPEYLAAGKPVVSTSITDVVRPWAERGVVRIANQPEAFIAAVEAALIEDRSERLARADAALRGLSWDNTWGAMNALIRAACRPSASAVVADRRPGVGSPRPSAMA